MANGGHESVENQEGGDPIVRRAVAAMSAITIAASLGTMFFAGKIYGISHCAPWERFNDDRTLAVDAAHCSLRGGDFDSAEKHVDAIDDLALRREADHIVDYAQGAGAVRAAEIHRDFSKARKVLDLVEIPAVHSQAEAAIQSAQEAENANMAPDSTHTWDMLYRSAGRGLINLREDAR